MDRYTERSNPSISSPLHKSEKQAPKPAAWKQTKTSQLLHLDIKWSRLLGTSLMHLNHAQLYRFSDWFKSCAFISYCITSPWIATNLHYKPFVHFLFGCLSWKSCSFSFSNLLHGIFFSLKSPYNGQLIVQKWELLCSQRENQSDQKKNEHSDVPRNMATSDIKEEQEAHGTQCSPDRVTSVLLFLTFFKKIFTIFNPNDKFPPYYMTPNLATWGCVLTEL